MEKEIIEKQIKDAKWNIDYFEEKIKEEKIKLEIYEKALAETDKNT